MSGKEQPEEQVKGQVMRMTRQQAEEKMECLREFFPVVRLVDAGNRSKENQTENVQRPNENNDLYRDALTGAYNRRFYEDQLRRKYQPSV